MKKLWLIILFFTLAVAAIAAVGTTYVSSPEHMTSGGGTSEGTTYQNSGSIGGNAIGTSSNSAYSMELGFIAASVSFSTSEGNGNAPSPISTIPTITTILFDGKTFQSGDSVNNDTTITATVSDTLNGINTSTSSIEIDSTLTSFSALSGDSSYNSTTDTLTYKGATDYTDGTHTMTIHARNNGGESTSETVSFVVNNSALQASSVLPFPNPYNPNNGNLEITYSLNKDGEVKIYIFNTLGQLIWKNSYLSGATGGLAGYNTVPWDGRTTHGQLVSNDIYICQIISGGKAIGKCKIAVLK